MATELFPANSPDVLYLVDLSNYIFRAYHAIAPLSNPNGEPTHAVLGTVNMLERLVRQRKPYLFAVAMDSGRATFRSEIYSEYKATRPPAPEDLRQQIARCEAIIRAFNVPVLKQEGVEADDLIASTVFSARKRGIKVVVVGADKDLMQLVGPDVVLWDTLRERVFGVPEVEARFGVRIEQIRDFLALTGDTSDNIPGVPSVGPKTAKELLDQFQNLESIFSNLPRIQRKALREKLIAHQKDAELSQRLVTLKEDCPIDMDLVQRAYGGRDVTSLRKLYTELGFQRHLLALDQESTSGSAKGSEPPPSSVSPGADRAVVRIPTLTELAQLISSASNAGKVAVTALGQGTNPMQSELLGVSLCVEAGQSFYLPLHGGTAATPLADANAARKLLGLLFADQNVRKLCHDFKYFTVLSEENGLHVQAAGFDIALASYLLDPEGRHDHDSVVQRELGIVPTPYDSLTVKQRGVRIPFSELTLETQADYLGQSAHYARVLADKLSLKIADNGLEKLYTELELPLAAQLAQMERRGVLVDNRHLATLGQTCEQDIARLEKAAHQIAGKEFNVNSPRQLETLLFDELGLKPIKRTKTARSTDAETLESLAEQHALPKIILEIRQLAKLKGTYIDALPALSHPRTGRIHTTWEQAVAATGRLSSSNPNLQNIPIRTELGRSIREAFIAPPGYQLVSADYSQIELRVLAHLSEDPVLIEAFRTGQDIHTRTAMEIFEVPEAEVTRELRTRAKAVNFGVIYGQGDSGLAKVLGIPRLEAGNFIATYFRRYAGVRKFMNETLEKARAGESVRSALGRRRLLPTIRSANRAERLAAERVAMNTPIQGTAADILKLAMLKLREPPTPGARLVLTVHDELIFEVPEAEIAEALPRLKNAMQSAFELHVPLLAEVGHGPNWNQAH